MRIHGTRARGMVLGLVLAVGVASQGWTAEQLALHLVWTRVGDVNGEEGSIESVEFSPDGRFIVSGSKFDNQLIMWRTSDGAEVWRQTVGEEIERVGWSPDGKLVASASEDQVVQIWNATDGELVRTLEHGAGIDALAWSYDGNWLATGEESTDGDQTGYIRLFRTPDFVEEHVLDQTGTVNELDFNHDDSLLASAGHDGELRIWRTDDWSQVRLLQMDPQYHLVTASFSPDGAMVATAGFEGTVYIYKVEDWSLVRKFNHTGDKIECVKWTPNGDYILTAGHDPSVLVFRLSDILHEEQIPIAYRSLATDNMEYMHFNATGSLLTTAHQDGMVRLWVWMSEDPTVNARRHRWVRERQRVYEEQSQKQ